MTIPRVDESALYLHENESWSDTAAEWESEPDVDVSNDDFATEGEYSGDQRLIVGWAPVIIPILGVATVGGAYLIAAKVFM